MGAEYLPTPVPLNRKLFLSAGSLLDEFLDWPAWSCRVDNFTTQWLHFQDTDEFVAPGVYGAIVQLAGNPYAQAEFAAPVGIPQPPALTGTEARLIFYSTYLPPTPGSSAFVQPQTVLGSVVAGTTKRFQLPSGSQTIFVVYDAGVTQITVLGVQTAVKYINQTIVAGTPSTAAGLVTAADAQVDVTPTGGSVTVLVTPAVGAPFAVTIPQNVNVANFPADQLVHAAHLNVDLSTRFAPGDPVSGTVGVNNFPATQPVSGTVGVNNFPATQPVSGTVAVSNFPNPDIIAIRATQPYDQPLSVAPFDFTVNNGATGPVVAGVGGKKVYCYRFQVVSLTTAPGFYWELQDDTALTDLLRFGNLLSADYPNLDGIATGTGNGVQIKNISGVNLRIAGTLHYVQV